MSQALLAGLSRTTRPQSMVRRFLALDALVTGANGLAYLAASGPLGELFGVDSALLLELGVVLALYAAGVAWAASRTEPPVLGVKIVVDINVAWTLLSVVALLAWLEPTTAGVVWTLVQAATVAGFAGLQWSALRAAATR
ncbi:hypothetical protein Q5762_24020 [Streptomyces sp. P9(2023)]|uniref:hypothetical protein n=1 Tax=Streptomyces sp. P9(2023) TaxID=3064394 RepID=UPI0028F41EAF|nr:hypothetical protein [Streptomyces sp. P9(2023)]MDT9691355.1 hypothetical protein [Streptomyces sp. P9(2023)]